jgi:hypothetical protein
MGAEKTDASSGAGATPDAAGRAAEAAGAGSALADGGGEGAEPLLPQVQPPIRAAGTKRSGAHLALRRGFVGWPLRLRIVVGRDLTTS